jgi:predicted ATP-binding protein involved in virulence
LELVYLWVEEYKNIHKQGFNFSSKFIFDYAEDSNELTIDDNPNHIKNFFGENINVTAIVGKNGSGKSSVLECIELGIKSFLENDDIEFNAKNPNFKKNILIYKDSQNIYYNIGNIQVNNLDIINCRTNNNLYSKQLSQQIRIWKYKEKNNINREILKVFDIMNSQHISFFSPDKIVLDFSEYINEDIISEKINLYNQIDWLVQQKFHEIQKDLEQPICSYTAKNIQKIQDFLQNFKYKIFYLEKLNNLKIINKFLIENQDIMMRLTPNPDFLYVLDGNIPHNIEFLLNLDTFGVINIYDSSRHEINDETYIDFGITTNSLSSGEKNLLNILLDLVYKVNHCTQDNLCILIDEPDNMLHPYWQKNFLLELINNSKYFSKNIHFILTTHSPFLLSDIPKQNIIFLDKDEEGKCKIVDGLKDKKQTFGANIHTLLSDSFFMEDGLMGEFAKGKIEDVYNFIVHHKTGKIKTKEDAQDIINIIGEPLIQRELQQLFDKKFELSNMTIDDEISVLERKIQALKKIKNDTD